MGARSTYKYRRRKKVKILNSAMKEFSKNTFQKASTNKIVEDAGISKGILFHYFGSKKKLYEYLEYFAIKVITDSIVEKLDWDQSDIFLRMKEISMIKFTVFQKYSFLSEFSLVVFQDKSLEEMMAIYPDFPVELYSQVYTLNIDYSLFKENLDIEKAMNIIRWTLEKYSEDMKKMENKKLEFDARKIEKDLLVYMEMLRTSFYK
ncbi:TetR/AcrR family transcriptional regulator [Jeotgalibaca sp. MA1X17-3]|uniref:TetR/AcrR family transcriptional regulator n=1 Tax=Jeotgalibaca sp. MA1X17-3 TaxID=2908211 RepID=UPI001F3091A3|nr:TetR/AcrR family transcriptional regulator [Jeotgalibaca sp. MA1X17-3]UJF14609.1 TetR/AcrR family transcriptional regulator [Jeotgalibaca sp. MA1X17-3]